MSRCTEEHGGEELAYFVNGDVESAGAEAVVRPRLELVPRRLVADGDDRAQRLTGGRSGKKNQTKQNNTKKRVFFQITKG